MARRSAAEGYGVVEISDFGGLDVRRDPQDASPVRAIDMLNVDLQSDGRIRSRPGSTKLVSQSASSSWYGLTAFVPGGTSTPQVIVAVGGTGELRAYNASTGSLVASGFTPAGSPVAPFINDAVMFGDPDEQAVMYLVAEGADNGVKYDGSDFSSVTGIGGGIKHLAVQHPDNRLVMANYTESSTRFRSRVLFSAPNDPEDFTNTDDFVDLVPGDGEEIVGLANFRDFLFAFKQSAFFVFYGNSTDDQGGTVFNYRTVRHNLATPANVAKVCAAGREGVYFLAKDGIYLTDGGYPRRVSAPLDPLFRGPDDTGYFVPGFSDGFGSGDPAMGLYYAGGRLYFMVALTRMFVYDPQRDAWMFWIIGAPSLASIRAITTVALPNEPLEVPYFLTVSGISPNLQSVISYLDPAAINDQGHSLSVGFNSYYHTNFLDLGSPGAQKVIREIELEGYLSAKRVGVRRDNANSTLTADFVSVTTTPAISGSATWPNYLVGQGRARQAWRARNFGLCIGGASVSSNASWALHRAMLHLRGERPAGVQG